MQPELAIPTRIRILVVDDHPAIRRGLAATLDPEPDLEVIGCAATSQQGIEMSRAMEPDVTLMDLALRDGCGGIEAIREIRLDSPAAKIIVFSAFAAEEDVYQALRSGAVTFLTKNVSDRELIQTIRDVHAGMRPIPPEIAQRLADRIGEPSLTPREIDVLNHVARGLRNKEIAAALSISEQTTQAHLRNIFFKLGVHDRTGAAFLAEKRGIIHAPAKDERRKRHPPIRLESCLRSPG